jgi:hypothetical protein
MITIKEQNNKFWANLTDDQINQMATKDSFLQAEELLEYLLRREIAIERLKMDDNDPNELIIQEIIKNGNNI